MLNLEKDIRPISYVKSHTAEMIKQVEDTRSPVVITQNGEAKAVLVDVASYQSLVDSVNLMKLISIGERDFREGRVLTNDELDKKVIALLGE
ncbi:MAG: type II toxin-antitoxin system Phd/YefM family antitoxin [Spirochaetales bacterium]|nr:type II toxin-antitoxin system Phd/YefM family antitoxin [Spirochaetales bacterium]